MPGQHFVGSIIYGPLGIHPKREGPNQLTRGNEPSFSGQFDIISWLEPFLFGHCFDHSNDNIQFQKALEFKGIIYCSRPDFSSEGGQSWGESLFLYPPCSLGAVLLTL